MRKHWNTMQNYCYYLSFANSQIPVSIGVSIVVGSQLAAVASAAAACCCLSCCCCGYKWRWTWAINIAYSKIAITVASKEKWVILTGVAVDDLCYNKNHATHRIASHTMARAYSSTSTNGCVGIGGLHLFQRGTARQTKNTRTTMPQVKVIIIINIKFIFLKIRWN